MGLGLLAAFVMAFFSVQRWGVGRLLAGLAQRILPAGVRGNEAALLAIDANLRRIYANPRRLGAAILCHSAAWLLGISEAGLALWLMHDWPGLCPLVILEAVVFTVRTTAFFIPAGLGVQEAGYVFLGAALGLGPETMIALALVKRARELSCGVPVLIAVGFVGTGRWPAPGASAKSASAAGR